MKKSISLLAVFLMLNLLLFPSGLAEEPFSTPKPITKIRINEGSNPNVRSKPSTDGEILGNAKSEEIYELLATSENWYKIRLENGTEGWIANRMVTILSGGSNSTASNSSVFAADSVKVEEIILNQDTAVLSIGKMLNLKATITPAKATNKNLEWVSSDESIAAVSNGKVKGLSEGTAIITAKATDGSNAVAYFTVNIVNPVKKITLYEPKIILAPDTTWEIHPIFTPISATIKDVVWSSSNDKIASVDEKGLITGHKVGNCTITGLAQDDSGCKVTVNIQVKNFDYVIREPAPIPTGLNLANAHQSSTVSFPGFFSHNEYERYVSYGNDVVGDAGSGQIKPLKAGEGTIECVAKDNGRVTEKWKYSVYVAQSAISMESDEEIQCLEARIYNGHTYQVFYSHRSWSEAEAFCERHGGHLITITDAEEQHFIEVYLKNVPGAGTYWIGMTNGTNKKIEWVTKEPVKYQNWMGPNPDYDGTNSGVRIASDYYVQDDGWIMERGTWDDTWNTYDGNAGFICEWDDGNLSYAVSINPDKQMKILEDGKLGEYNGHRYQIFEDKCSWSEAKEKCEQSGGHLVTITSLIEQQLLEHLNKDNLVLWIGLRKNEKEEWGWITGETLEYKKWARGEPNNYQLADFPGENAGDMNNAGWNDCHENNEKDIKGYICEWEDIERQSGLKFR